MRQANDTEDANMRTSPSVNELLSRLDLATEVLEGLDELGVDNRVQLQALMDKIERQIADEE
jgi:predicted transcriptional regulator